MARWAIRIAVGLLILFGAGGCKKRSEAGGAGPEKTPAVDVSADRAAVRKSWIVELARDPAPLMALAQSSPGWAKFFGGDAAGALEAFQGDLEGAAPGSPVRIGAARAALELAEAHYHVAALLANLVPRHVEVVRGRPAASQPPHLAAWTSYVLARQAQAVGADPKPKVAAVGDGSPAAPWARAAAGQGDPAVAALLAGRAEGADATPPPGATGAYAARLRLACLVAAGRTEEVRRLLPRIDADQPDIVLGEGSDAVRLWDPLAARALARAHALLAFDALEGADGWAALYRAEAQRWMGRPAEAAATLEALLKAPPDRANLPELVLTGVLDAAELVAEATALRVRALAEAGQKEAAKKLLAALSTETVAGRVRRTWAGSFVGEPVDPKAFPDDRIDLSRAVSAEIAALGEGAQGAGDVTALALVDRYVDAVQRRFADALDRGSLDAQGVKVLEAAEDKTEAFAPSPRNRLPALARAALENVDIGRPRVALKYLSRLRERLPAVAGPADILRDLLTVRAMEQSGGAAVGQ